ncbi:MAG: tetratricopeptide repeat protein [Myxococcaceae bacterium]|nr:tetratricopeptide repeat protein [Myxococcaceae bacterium]
MAFLKPARRGTILACLALWSLSALFGCEGGSKPVDPKTRAEGLYVHGTALYLQGKFDEALKAFEQMKTIVPDDPRLPAAVGEVYLSQSKLREALEYFQTAAAKDPKRSTNWSRIGFIQAQLGKNDEARSALRKAIGLNPHDFNALEALGDVDLHEHKVREAAKNYALAAEASPRPDAQGQLYVKAARVLEDAKDEAGAIQVLEQGLAKGTQTADVQAELGELYVRARRFDDALPVLIAAAQNNPVDPTLWQMVGELYLAKDKPGDAIAAFQQSLKVKDRAEVHGSLARIHKARGDTAAAAEELDKALQVATGEEAESRELAKLLIDFGRKKDALKLLDALAKEPEQKDDAALQLKTAKLAKEVGDRQTMEDACQRARSAPDAGVTRCP